MSKLALSLYDHYDICVIKGDEISTTTNSSDKLFDVASLTKAIVHILICRLYARGEINIQHRISSYIKDIANSGERTVLDFLRFTVQSYGFDYPQLKIKPYRTGGDIEDLFIYSGFQTHLREHRYDNVATVFLGILLKKITGINNLQGAINYLIDDKGLNIVFHPDPKLTVNNQFVHDPFACNQRNFQIATAGIFSRADILAKIFYQQFEYLLNRSFYSQISSNTLEGVDNRHSWAMGFDIPYPDNPVYCFVEKPLVFAGYTGCRIFFGIEKTKSKPIVICILTDRVYKNDSPQSRRDFSKWFWEYVISVLNEQVE